MLLPMEASRLLKLISITLLLACRYPPAMAVLPSLEEQAGALLAWKATLQSHPAQLQSWGRGNTTTWPCSWYGISCSKAQARHREVVVGISLKGLGLRGELHTLNFTALSTLTTIQLSRNQIRGSFPPALPSSLPNLRHLMLHMNELSGEIPSQVKKLESLVGLVLSDNHLSGPIPSKLGYLWKLRTLDFSNNNLRGPIPKNLGNLTELTILRLGGNQLSGHLPPELGYLVKLQKLSVRQNNLTGYIPDAFGSLVNLSGLYIWDNELSGNIPGEIGKLMNLEQLELDRNQLMGSIPHNFGNLTKLTSLYLCGNQLSGHIPQELGNLVSLEHLGLDNNQLMGAIPHTFGNLTKLFSLELWANQLFGRIPRELGNLLSLEFLELDNNQLMGSIPYTFGNLTKLLSLNLWANKLSGHIPRELGYLVNLEDCELDKNQLMGSIPHTFGNLTKLTKLQLGGNQLSGHVPREIGTLMHLVILEIEANNLHGPLPPELCAGGMLMNLSAHDNNLNGPLPPSLVNCKSLVRVRLERNQIEGDIFELEVFPNLVYMDMSSNKLFGEISYHWKECHNLTMLRLSNNKLTGKIPASIGRLSQLRILDLSANKLEGELPSAMGNLKSLFQLSVAHNLLHGSIPREIGKLSNLELLDLSSNNLRGSVQGSIKNCFKLRYLKLSHNKFKGNIPSELGVMLNLQELLDLSVNQFTGAIPSLLSGLILLGTMNLSHNELIGSIPSSFQSMKSLTSIDVSYNQLEGPVPESELFQGAPVEWFMHNKILCGVVKGLPICSSASQSGGKKKGYRTHVLATVPSFVSLVIVALIFMFRHGRKNSSAIYTNKATKLKVFSVWSFDGADVFKQIVEATGNFNEMHCIGIGGYGCVYKATLSTSEIFAVKKIHVIEDECCLKESVFNREVEALVHIQHRNVVKLFGYCSSSQGRFLVYEYMERGNLAETLKVNERAVELDWKRRINIVFDVVHALAYMLHDYSSPIVHRDITSNNILLDGEFRACISDFGTAKILNINGLNITRLAGTKGYLAPELAYTENVTEKCDLYSFGVLVFELFMGFHPGDLLSSIYVTTNTNHVCVKDLMDARLELPDGETAREIYGMLSVAVQCLEHDPSRRPTARRARDELSAVIKTCEDRHINYLHAVLTIPS